MAADRPFPAQSASAVRNRVGWPEHLARLRGSSVVYDLRRFDAAVAAVNALEPPLRELSDAGLDAAGRTLRTDAAAAGPDGDFDARQRARLRARTFAIVRELARRELGLRAFDEQVVAALALDDAAIVEVQTGEGKTLAAVMPAALNALTGRGTHVLTFNDYLARRDAAWMGPIYRRLGLTVGCVQQQMPAGERRAAYGCDVTYVTAKEAGFDLLRDLLVVNASDVVHRPPHFALVDEADSIMLDEARSPLVIAGRVETEGASVARAAAIVAALEPGRDFETDEHGRDVELTERGADAVERALACGPLHDPRNLAILTDVNCALHARVLLRRDVDYLVRDGRIAMVDELTGRIVADRHWPDGLQAALEAKEGLSRTGDGRILGTITLQHVLRRYPRLCGMTGTARDGAAEILDAYGLPIVVVPTHRPVVREDRPDVVFARRAAKERAVVAEVVRAHVTRRPVLVGTSTVEESERIAARLAAEGVACRVLNARQDAAEAEVVANAGGLGAVTIATNMAGRGTDIRLGGPDETDREAVAALGGLYVIGTNRHESRRIDLQLRGRAGRQGDPGETRFFVSLEDPLLVRYGIEKLLAGRFTPAENDAPIEHPVVRAEVARAQRIVDWQNFEIRRTLCRYADAVEDQRWQLMDRRVALLEGRATPDVWRSSPEIAARLAPQADAAALDRAEILVTLHAIDAAWRDHLELVAELREGVHLVSLGGRDPLRHFRETIAAAFAALQDRIDAEVLAAADRIQVRDGRLDVSGATPPAPASTWTYVVSDDPFRHQIGMLLTGTGRATFAIGAAVFAMPLLVLWGLVDTWAQSRRHRRRRLP